MTKSVATGTDIDREREFYLAIGKCISQWAIVDEELFRIFHLCAGGPLKQCAIIYYRMPGLEARLSCTDELVKSVFPPPARKSGGHPHKSVKEWSPIKNEFSKLLSVRRRIAHFPVGIEWQGKTYPASSVNKEALERYNPELAFQVYMSENEAIRGYTPNLTVTDLQMHLKEVTNLRDQLKMFLFMHLGHLTARQETP
jgi:hypothetical protein